MRVLEESSRTLQSRDSSISRKPSQEKEEEEEKGKEKEKEKEEEKKEVLIDNVQVRSFNYTVSPRYNEPCVPADQDFVISKFVNTITNYSV